MTSDSDGTEENNSDDASSEDTGDPQKHVGSDDRRQFDLVSIAKKPFSSVLT